ncbi:MAG: hypothetical protein WAM51_08595, partial [Methylovirgula sp.]
MRDLARFAEHRAHHAADREFAVAAHPDEGRGRQLPLRRVGHDSECGKWQMMRGGDARRDMRLRIGGDGAGRYVERPFSGGMGDRQI